VQNKEVTVLRGLDVHAGAVAGVKLIVVETNCDRILSEQQQCEQHISIYPVPLEDGGEAVQFEAILYGLVVIVALAQGRDSIPAERLASRDWYRDAKFGMFVHWGVYSQLAQGEWVMQNRPISVPDYEWLASTFNPVKFDARAWVSLAKAAGVRYITITSRHHDGFAMFATKATRYNVVDWTPFHRDPLRELADECRRQGIKLFFYYSQLDWHHPDYWPRGSTGHNTGRPESGDWNRYLDFLDAQLTELLTTTGHSAASGSTGCGTSPMRTGGCRRPTR
jgi:hypothetical protein